MIKQLIFSGSVTYDTSIMADADSIDKIYKACQRLNLTGLKLYTDGGYFFIAEGSPQAVQTIKEAYAKHKKLSNLIVLLESNIAQAEFDDFKIYCRERDAHSAIPNCFTLDEKNLDIVLRSKTSEVTNILVKTFARVNNLLEA